MTRLVSIGRRTSRLKDVRARRLAPGRRWWGWGVLGGLGLVIVGVIAPLGVPPAAAGLPGTYSNPLSSLDTPDSDVVRLGDTYYAFSTGDGFDNIPVMTTTDLSSWPQMLLLSPNVTDALPCQTGTVMGGNCQISGWATRAPDNGAPWAPSMIQVGSEYFLFYAAWDPAVAHYCVGVAESPEAIGPYVDNSTEPVVCQPDLGGSIDPDVYQNQAGTYDLAWKNNDGYSSSDRGHAVVLGRQLRGRRSAVDGADDGAAEPEPVVGNDHRTTGDGAARRSLAPVLLGRPVGEQHLRHRLRLLPGSPRPLCRSQRHARLRIGRWGRGTGGALDLHRQQRRPVDGLQRLDGGECRLPERRPEPADGSAVSGARHTGAPGTDDGAAATGPVLPHHG